MTKCRNSQPRDLQHQPKCIDLGGCCVPVTFQYDGQNRLKQASYGDETITYSYDQGPNALGRLSTLTDGSGNTSFSYDSLGRVTSKTQTVTLPSGNRSLGMAYQHQQGQLQQLTLPSGHTLGYSYRNGQLASITLNGQPLVSSIQFYPFGELKGWSIQGKTLSRSFDRDGRIAGYSLPTGSRTLGYDALSRITSLTDSISASLNQTFGYDALDRLTSANGAFSQSFDYDAVGNRLKLTQGAQITTYTPAANSNRLASITAANTTSLTYDAVGNITSDGTFSYVYNNRNRLSKVTQAAVTKATYLYNGFGERVAKTVGTLSTLYAYDEDGHTLGEYDGATGTPIQETVWLNDTPVAVIKPKTGGGTEIYAIYPDHLDTPRVITDATGKIVWRWDSPPFGETAANDDPDADGIAFVYNLRFPGQLIDAETKLHYNYFRDYNPQTGRYVQSDPIGLDGGVNTYGYVESSPLNGFDDSGLAKVPGPKRKDLDRYRKKQQCCGNKARAFTVCIDITDNRRTSFGHSGHGKRAHSILKNRFPKKTLTNFPLGNCGEIDAANQLLSRGSKFENIRCYTIDNHGVIPPEIKRV